MHLSPRQLDRFFDLLDALLVFANGRLRLVDGLMLPIVGEEAEAKAAFVCEMLWQNREVIEEFVRVNPKGMTSRDLDAVAAWKDALVGDFTLVRHERGRALMMHEAGLFAVAGLDGDPELRLPQAPDILHAVLLPFEGIIVTDGLEAPSGIPLNGEEMREMQADLARLSAQGVVDTADGLRERAAEFNRGQRERELDALLASVELEARQSREGERLPEGYHRGVLAGLSPQEREQAVRAHAPASPPGAGIPSPGNALANGPAAPAGSDSPADEELAYEQDRLVAVLNCADALAQMCGLMTLREAYDAYRSVVLDVVGLERFVAVLMQEDSRDVAEFALQEWRGQSYLMHYTICDAYAREWVTQRRAEELGRRASGAHDGRGAAAAAEVAESAADELELELASLEEYRSHLLECHMHTSRRLLEPQAVDGRYLESLAARPPVVQLRDFLDAHVPDGEDDYTYADRAVDEVILHSIDSGDALAFLEEVEQAGLAACAEDGGLLPRLLENAYGALPSWEFNGWSPQEVMEQMMGRRIFYNVRGEMLHPAPDDRCPCGSGKPYRECHGS